MDELLGALSNIFSLCFIVGSMLALGFSLYPRDIIAPLRKWSLVWRVLLVNFIAVPAFAYGVSLLFRLDGDYSIGIVLIGMCAGAPFIPKLIQLAHSDVASAVGVMALLMVATVFFVPAALPLLLPHVEVSPMAIAGNLILLMLLPLSLALFVHTRYKKLAEEWQPICSRIANIGLGGLIITMLVKNGELLMSLGGTGLPLATVAFIIGAFLIGLIFAQPHNRASHALYGFSAAQRNVAAAMVVASQSFADKPGVTVVIIVMAIALNVLLLIGAAEWGKQTLKKQGDSANEAAQDEKQAAHKVEAEGGPV